MKISSLRRTLLLMLMFTASSAWGAVNITPNDFGYGFTVNFLDGKSVYEFLLPQNVYQSVTRSDLGDIRIFNSNSEIVPHEIITQDKNSLTSIAIPSKPLTFFPLYSEHESTTALKGIAISTNSQGTIIKVGTSADDLKAKEEKLSGYLIDASMLEAPIKNILVKFATPNNKQFFKKISINGSNDLEHWNNAASSSVLANLVHQKETLVKNIISLPHGEYKYYKLSWADHTEPVKIAKLTANFDKKSQVGKVTRNWFAVAGTIDSNDDASFLYELDGYYPVSSVQVSFSQPNTFGNVTIEARNDVHAQWVPCQTKNIYSLTKEGTILEEGTLNFSPRRFKYWRLKLNSQKEAFGSHAPELKFGWAPEKLRFLARGTSPFFAGFGNSQIAPMAPVSLQENGFSESIGIASLTDYTVIGGKPKLTSSSVHEYPWKSWILWAVLVLGVCGLGKMAYSLMKSMNDENKAG